MTQSNAQPQSKVLTRVKLPENAAQAMENLWSALGNLPAQIKSLAQVFTQAGEELSLVGGPVRDAMLGVAPHDWDLTTSARPDKIEQLLKEWGAGAIWDMGREFGTIGGQLQGLAVEITTYRADEYVPSSRKPKVAFGDSLEGDLSRRDFTVNAMSLRLPDLTLLDPHNGLGHLIEGTLQTPIKAEHSFDDDPLRMMRAARFASQLGLDPSYEVLSAMRSMNERIEIVSAERVRSELERLMIGVNPRKGLEIMVYTGLCERVLPELSALQNTVDEHKRHKDVYEHTLTVLDKAMALETGPEGAVPAPDFVTRFAAIMHDVGKPATRRFESDGTVSFHHHEIVGAKMTRKRMKALKFDKQTTNDVCDLVALHLRFHGYGEQAWTDSAVRRYVTDAGPLLERLGILTRADCTTRNKRKAQRLAFAYDDLEQRIAKLREQEAIDAIRPDLDGQQIMQLLGISPGRVVGRAYKYLLELRMEHGPLGKEEATRALLLWWAEQPESEQATQTGAER